MTIEADTRLSRYISTVRGYPDLDRATETRLARLWKQSRDPNAADQLVRAHLKHVVAIALRYRRYGLPVAELVAEGNFGVAHALTKYDAERGTRFVTYAAYWVRAYILSYVIRSWSMVGGGSGALRSKVFFKLRRERVRLANLIGADESMPDRLAERLHLPVSEVTQMLRRLEARDVSLDARVYDDSPTTLVDTLQSKGRDQEQDLAATESADRRAHAVRVALSGLDSRERFIVESRLMADGDDELSLAELGRQMGVSRELARQLEERAKRKLRSRISEVMVRTGDTEADWVTAA